MYQAHPTELRTERISRATGAHRQRPGGSRYVRDNIPVSLLAKAYAAFVGASPPPGTMRRLNPSGYAESQGAFTRRLRDEVAARLGLSCPLELGTQTDFPEPPVRINTDLLDPRALGWSEAQAWDDFVRFYRPAG